MNELLLLAGGGLAAYFLLRNQPAQAASKPTTPEPAPMAPVPTPTQAPVRLTANVPTPPMAKEVVASKALPPQLLHPLPGRWVWPVPRWEGRAPVISDGFGSPRGTITHAGVDVMFARIASDPFPVGSPNGSKWFVMPDAWMAVAVSDGVLWSAGHTPRGYAVVLDHGNVATFYTHLDTLFVPVATPPAKGTDVVQRVHVKAGQPLGVIGGDPQDPARLKHLHFELWLGGPTSAIDPKPIMATWQVPTPSDIAPFLSTMTRNAKAKRKGQSHPDLVQVVGHARAWPGTALHRG